MTRFNAAFRAWFGNSRVVDRRGNPRVVYHGTTHEFETFDPDKANIEDDWGKAIYFTSDRRDVSINYAGIGPDLKARIERLAETIDEGEGGDMTPERAMQLATERLSGSAIRVIPCYLSLQNPVIIGGPRETILDYEYGPTEDDIQHFMPLAREDDPDADEHEVRQKAYGMAVENNYESERGLLFEFFENLVQVASHYEETDLGQIEELKSNFLGHERVPAGKLRDELKKCEGLVYATDEEGNMASSEIIREAFERTGFDGVIDFTARQRFGLRESQDLWTGRRKKYGMHGMYPGTVHYVAFRPEQVKSIFNIGTWSAHDPNVLRNPDQATTVKQATDWLIQAVVERGWGADEAEVSPQSLSRYVWVKSPRHSDTIRVSDHTLPGRPQGHISWILTRDWDRTPRTREEILEDIEAALDWMER